MTILLDNGHGVETYGKRSPDGIFREWAWCRDVAHVANEALKAKGYHSVLLVPEDNDIPLRTRCNRANELARYDDAALLVSIHVNAAGNGREWAAARGWEVLTYTNPSAGSIRLANAIFDEAKKKGFRTRPESPAQHYRRKNLMILRETTCPAVLVENFFMDNREDCKYLLSFSSIYDCAGVLVDGIIKYIGK